MTTTSDLTTSALSDEQVLSSVKSLACAERRATAQLIAALAELDRRKLFLGQGYPSLFNYCTQVLQRVRGGVGVRIFRASRAPDRLQLGSNRVGLSHSLRAARRDDRVFVRGELRELAKNPSRF